MNIYLVGVLVSIVVYILVGNYAGSKVEDVNDYYVSGRNAPTLLIAGTLFASMLSTNGFMGDTAYAYTGHMTVLVMLNTIMCAGYVLGPYFFGRYLRRSEELTMPAYFGNRFHSKKVQKFAGFTTVISLVAYLIAVIQGTGILMSELTGFSFATSLIISWVCFTSFTFYSGSKGVILTDTMMFIIFIVATVIAGPFIFKAAGGVSNVIPTLLEDPAVPKEYLSYHGVLEPGQGIWDNLGYGISMGLIWLVTVSVSPWQASRGMMAKDEHVTFRAGAVAAICSLLFLTFLYFIAVTMQIVNPDIVPTEKVIIWACYNIVPPIIGVFVLTGVMAAGLSSASTFLSVAGFSAINDVVEIEFESEEKQLWASRWIMLAVGLVALVLAYIIPSNIRIITWFASTIIAASWGPVAFYSVWSKKITADGAHAGMVTGFVVFLVAKALQQLTNLPLHNVLDPFFIGIVASILAIHLADRNKVPSAEEKKYLKELHVVPKSEKDPKKFKRDHVYGNLLILSGLIMGVFMIVFWAIPYMTQG